jgi:hypothetical protein
LIYSSDFTRARETAETIHSSLRLPDPIVIDIRLRERRFGDLNGLSAFNRVLPDAYTTASLMNRFLICLGNSQAMTIINSLGHAMLSLVVCITRIETAKGIFVIIVGVISTAEL